MAKRRWPALPAMLLAYAALAPTASVHGWDEEGHVIVTRMAWEKLPDDMPNWLKTPSVRYRLEYLSAEPDRWRGQHNVHLDHINNPDHYIDVEELADFGLSLKTLPPLRREFLDILATQRAQHPEKFPGYNRKRDKLYTRLVPGLLPYEIAEMQWKLAASWTTLKTYELHRSLVTDEMIENARQNIVYQMGILSHFIGDGAQPLHVTRHHNGWKGDNPKGYTVDSGFHAFIDGGVIALHKLTSQNMAALAAPPSEVSTELYWTDINAYLMETFEQLEPLYELEKSGALRKAKGKAFIQDRLRAGGAMLAGVWDAAYKGAVIDDFRVKRLQEKGKKPASTD